MPKMHTTSSLKSRAGVRSTHLGDVPRNGRTDELGELVVAHLTPLRVVTNLS